ncbi:hypothetical protein HG536_0D05890 [Torulaspora globosa]|uniref:Uncharacterized protein n=1 Tax=Torulaspora globosa TaxID=48254 RepID=A0A7G3ZHT1_9SACH|nr:uncharacterized protein HG536_0D05890 [Torulaspora globosa]QLL33067.1 hypothetical protein HG536_0D05890 [Torulaspora globosa]
MDTPRGSRDVSDGQTSRGTPFRERAIEERRLKDELLRSATPGLKRRPESWIDESRVREDPVELKSYLRDLSAVLALQERRNLTNVLMEEDRGVLESDPAAGTSSVNVLKDSVFSLLKADRARPKIRKVQTPIVIQDVESVSDTPEAFVDLPSSVESLAPVENSFTVASGQPEGVYEEPGVVQQDDLSDDSYSEVSEPDEPEPLTTSRLRRCLSLYMESEGMRLGKAGWRALQTASEALLKGMAQEMRDDEGRIVPDRQSILRAFVKFEVLAPNSSNEALFEVCCKYLTLEDLNKLEAALFP